jgi:phospholipid/cholesterol/gamma-HCH transport system ATP-binding protein
MCKESEIIDRSVKALHDVALEGYELALPGEVSIGMRKRVGIARALVTEPDVLLFDEPNTGLDPKTGQEIYELINKTQHSCGFTGIVVSHEIPEVFQVCDRVAMLYRGQVQEEGTIEEFLASKNPVVQQFVRGDIEGPIELNY